MNLNQVDKIKDIKQFDQYLQDLVIDYTHILRIQIESKEKESGKNGSDKKKERPSKSPFANLFRSKSK